MKTEKRILHEMFGSNRMFFALVNIYDDNGNFIGKERSGFYRPEKYMASDDADAIEFDILKKHSKQGD